MLVTKYWPQDGWYSQVLIVWQSYNNIVISPSARPEKKMGTGFPCRPHFFDTNLRINMCRLFIQVLYSAKICGNSITSEPLRVP